MKKIIYPYIKYPNFHLEQQYKGLVVGIDEVGTGSWAGPVIAVSFCFLIPPKRTLFYNLKDSKKVTKQKREKIYENIIQERKKKLCIFSIKGANVQEIDRLNILEATKKAMTKSFYSLNLTASSVLIDGKNSIKLPCPVKTIIKGDQFSSSIAAASIVAKITRDNIMKNLNYGNIKYQWNKNVGYGTKEHRILLLKNGPSQQHRKSFNPILSL